MGLTSKQTFIGLHCKICFLSGQRVSTWCSHYNDFTRWVCHPHIADREDWILTKSIKGVHINYTLIHPKMLNNWQLIALEQCLNIWYMGFTLAGGWSFLKLDQSVSHCFSPPLKLVDHWCLGGRWTMKHCLLAFLSLCFWLSELPGTQYLLGKLCYSVQISVIWLCLAWTLRVVFTQAFWVLCLLRENSRPRHQMQCWALQFFRRTKARRVLKVKQEYFSRMTNSPNALQMSPVALSFCGQSIIWFWIASSLYCQVLK